MLEQYVALLVGEFIDKRVELPGGWRRQLESFGGGGHLPASPSVGV
jgi:hypothetical protein